MKKFDIKEDLEARPKLQQLEILMISGPWSTKFMKMAHNKNFDSLIKILKEMTGNDYTKENIIPIYEENLDFFMMYNK